MKGIHGVFEEIVQPKKMLFCAEEMLMATIEAPCFQHNLGYEPSFHGSSQPEGDYMESHYMTYWHEVYTSVIIFI